MADVGRIVVAAADSVEVAVEIALDALPSTSPERPAWLLLPSHPLGRDLTRAASVVERRATSDGPPTMRRVRGAAGLGRFLATPETVAVSLPPGSERFAAAAVPAPLLAGKRMLLVALSGPERRTGPLTTLAGFATARQELAARVAGGGAAAELAAALCPVRFVLVGRVGGGPIAVATDDPVAGELVWVASAPSSPDAVVAWQAATVQRASALGLGARAPADLAIVEVGSPTPSIRSWIDQIRIRIGLPPDADAVS